MLAKVINKGLLCMRVQVVCLIDVSLLSPLQRLIQLAYSYKKFGDVYIVKSSIRSTPRRISCSIQRSGREFSQHCDMVDQRWIIHRLFRNSDEPVAPPITENSSGDEIANVNFYAVRPEAT